MTAKILLVCTANVCRSPLMEWLLRHQLPGVEIVSRGLEAVPGAPMCEESAKVLAQKGLSGRRHRSERLTVRDVRSSTLVLTATRWHRAAVCELRPSATVRTHTLPEAARVITWRASLGARPELADPSERVLWLAEQLHEHRHQAPRAAHVDDDDLPDPHNGAKHSPVLTQTSATIDALTRLITPGG